MFEQQNLSNNSNFSSTTPLLSEGLYPLSLLEQPGQSGMHFEKFNREISELLD